MTAWRVRRLSHRQNRTHHRFARLDFHRPGKIALMVHEVFQKSSIVHVLGTHSFDRAVERSHIVGGEQLDQPLDMLGPQPR